MILYRFESRQPLATGGIEVAPGPVPTFQHCFNPSREGFTPPFIPPSGPFWVVPMVAGGLLLPLLGHSVGTIFVLLDLVSYYVGFWCQFGLILPPNLEPKSSQTRSKSHPRCFQNRILFLITFRMDFCSIFDGFSIYKSTQNQ